MKKKKILQLKNYKNKNVNLSVFIEIELYFFFIFIQVLRIIYYLDQILTNYLLFIVLKNQFSVSLSGYIYNFPTLLPSFTAHAGPTANQRAKNQRLGGRSRRITVIGNHKGTRRWYTFTESHVNGGKKTCKTNYRFQHARRTGDTCLNNL